MRRLLVLYLVTLSSCASLDDDPGDNTRATRETITSGGRDRHYEWSAPKGRSGVPVILMFHGLGGNAEQMRRLSGMAGAGTRAGYVVVFAEASVDANRGWSVGCNGCTTGDVIGIDDVAYVDDLLDDLSERTSIDRTRVYVAGFSMGAWFSYTLACKRANIVRAIVPVGGLLPRPVAEQCRPSGRVDVLVIFGDRDQTQPYEGSSGEFGLLGADSSAIFWAAAAHCRDSIPETAAWYGTAVVRVMERTGCDGDVRIARHRIEGMDHTWPIGAYNATREALSVFTRR